MCDYPAFVLTSVCEAQRPQTKIGGGVRDAVETIFDRMNDLMNHHLRKHELKQLK